MNKEELAIQAIEAITGNDNVADALAQLDEIARLTAIEAASDLFPAVTVGDEPSFIYAVMTLTYLGVGFHGRDKWELSLAAAKINYRVGREAIKAACREAVDELIAEIQS